MPSDHDAAAAQVRSVRPLLAAARSRRGGGEQEVEASRKRPRRGAAIRASQAWTLDHSTASLVFEPLEGGACEAAAATAPPRPRPLAHVWGPQTAASATCQPAAAARRSQARRGSEGLILKPTSCCFHDFGLPAAKEQLEV